jgi:hypothetical protein
MHDPLLDYYQLLRPGFCGISSLRGSNHGVHLNILSTCAGNARLREAAVRGFTLLGRRGLLYMLAHSKSEGG